MTSKNDSSECPNCLSLGLSIIYDLVQIPVHSVLLHHSKQEAINIQKGDLRLGYCYQCGFVSNISFNTKLQNYMTENYEATQAYSGTFNAFHQNLAKHLISRHDLYGKKIIEIGCGQGEFLELLCNLGGNTGIGFDPAYIPKSVEESDKNITFIKDYYSEPNAHLYQADLICCKMTLEHIKDTYDFVKTIYNSLDDQPNTVVFFQVPNAQHVFQEIAFWDIYYEHCSYFSSSSLTYLFEYCGFEVIHCTSEYEDQYLLIEAIRNDNQTKGTINRNKDDQLEGDIIKFEREHQNILYQWKQIIRNHKLAGKKITLWGGGSKAVAFLTTLNITDEIEYVVDINPNKHGTYLAGTGQEVVSGDFLKSYKPDIIFVLNPIYLNEIQTSLDNYGIQCRLVPVNSLQILSESM